MWRFRVRPEEAGRRLDRILRARRPDLPWAHLQRLFREGAVTVAGAAARAADRPRAGVLVQVAARLSPLPPRPELAVSLLREEACFLAVNKPPGLPVTPGPRHRTRSLLNALMARFPELERLGPGERYGLVHRLDRDTSGVLLVARTPAARARLVAAFAAGEVRKRYRALVAGRPSPPQGTLRIPLQRQRRGGRLVVVPSKAGQPAVTHYRVLRCWRSAAELLLQPETGRTHQLRVHLAAQGHPILGETAYARAAGRAPRLCLHAWQLLFPHPETGERVRVTAPLPADYRRVRAELAG